MMESVLNLVPFFLLLLGAGFLLVLAGIAFNVWLRLAPQGGSSARHMKKSRQRQQEYQKRREEGAEDIVQDYGVVNPLYDDRAFDAIPRPGDDEPGAKPGPEPEPGPRNGSPR
jgi:hypothetical protein